MRPREPSRRDRSKMPRYITFLRAINVGGHNVKMDHLRQIFESFGFANVETFIASGNVVFESSAKKTAALEAKIATGLGKELGYEVATFIRTPTELANIASYKPFPPAELKAAVALNIAFLAEALDAKAKQKLMTYKTDIDNFAVHEREIYWSCLKKQSDSTFSNAVLERALGIKATLRGVNTVQKMAARYGEGES